MTDLTFRAHFFIGFLDKPGARPRSPDGPIKFTLPRENGALASVIVDFAAGKVQVVLPSVQVDEQFKAWLHTANMMYASEYPKEGAATVDAINLEMTSKAKQVLEQLKYFLGFDQIRDEVVSGRHDLAWSEDQVSFHSFANLTQGSVSFKSSIPLTAKIINALQEGLDKGYKPFLAMRHLYRAIQEESPRFKWIDATIAAELAVKECLARVKPELESLLVHLPSPPLSKLYGEVLLKYAGVKSPYVKKLNEGAQKRNQLVHQPQAVEISEAEAIEYVTMVMKAIHHLYTLLYPDWKIAQELGAIDRMGM